MAVGEAELQATRQRVSNKLIQQAKRYPSRDPSPTKQRDIKTFPRMEDYAYIGHQNCRRYDQHPKQKVYIDPKALQDCRHGIGNFLVEQYFFDPIFGDER